jgi:catechol 2,3-dioxygenase-like lactoylglutathione lyase family enzyme
MPLIKMEHFLVLTDDIEKTRDFYCQALGMTAGFRPPLGFPGYWLYLGETACIHVGEWETYKRDSEQRGLPVSKKAGGTGPIDHIAFSAGDYDAIADRLQKHGVKARLNVVPGIGLRQLFVEDPNGVKIEINVPQQ